MPSPQLISFIGGPLIRLRATFSLPPLGVTLCLFLVLRLRTRSGSFIVAFAMRPMMPQPRNYGIIRASVPYIAVVAKNTFLLLKHSVHAVSSGTHAPCIAVIRFHTSLDVVGSVRDVHALASLRGKLNTATHTDPLLCSHLLNLGSCMEVYQKGESSCVHP